jgi:hypothetical protein
LRRRGWRWWRACRRSNANTILIILAAWSHELSQLKSTSLKSHTIRSLHQNDQHSY